MSTTKTFASSDEGLCREHRMAVAHGQVLQKFCRYKIDDCDETNAGEHQRRWRFEAEPVPSGREGKRHRHDQCDQRRRCQNRIRKILPRRPLVRTTKMTRICVAIDSRNQAVWNSAGDALKKNTSVANVRKSNSDDIGPMIAANRTSPVYHTCGRTVASARTVSNGMPISERS